MACLCVTNSREKGTDELSKANGGGSARQGCPVVNTCLSPTLANVEATAAASFESSRSYRKGQVDRSEGSRVPPRYVRIALATTRFCRALSLRKMQADGSVRLRIFRLIDGSCLSTRAEIRELGESIEWSIRTTKIEEGNRRVFCHSRGDFQGFNKEIVETRKSTGHNLSYSRYQENLRVPFWATPKLARCFSYWGSAYHTWRVGGWGVWGGG